MKATPDNTVVLHWDEGVAAWSRLSWRDWTRFRGLGDGQVSMLIGAAAGEHYFLVCVLGSRGELCNAIPHRYIMTTDGRLVHGFDGLEETERKEFNRLGDLLFPTVEDSERCRQLLAREFAANLPPLHTVQPLMEALPGVAGAEQGAACWDFLSAIGICRSSTRPN
jgi:hypothetical protein